ncbi:hypothetical protein BGZ99_003075 [Dissophora globulifera]|uniref:D-lactate dehydratase n=1 Tax=Dissophora globulifera TaxID=979702 RepID=A0A9P6RV63_9FUNG|nr:hypothetical protein BGZ99_003075 [Dissophora globulifera]
MSASKKILIILTSATKLGHHDRPTGFYAEEVAEPVAVLTKHGYELVFASPKGGQSHVDAYSVESTKDKQVVVAFMNNKAIQDKIRNTHKVSEFVGRESEFVAILYPGGHGPMFDLEHDADALKLTEDAYNSGKVVSGVCHGVIALTDVKLPDGTNLIKGKNVTAFSDFEEEAINTHIYMPKSLELKVKEVGGHYHKADQAWGAKVVTDGRVVTGQNPASAHDFAEAVHAAIVAHHL